MNRSFLKLAAISTIAAFVLGVRALALPINGNVGFVGGATLDTPSLATATMVTGWSGVQVAPFGVTPGSALDTTINPGDAVTMAGGSWAFNSGKPALWTVGGFTFNLTSSSVFAQNSGGLDVRGYGTISGNGYDVTPGLWFFTSQGSPTTGSTFSFSATTTSVPDGGTTALLLGLGLTGLAVLGRGRKVA